MVIPFSVIIDSLYVFETVCNQIPGDKLWWVSPFKAFDEGVAFQKKATINENSRFHNKKVQCQHLSLSKLPVKYLGVDKAAHWTLFLFIRHKNYALNI